MSQRHPVWVAENHVNPCNSVHRTAELIPSNRFLGSYIISKFGLRTVPPFSTVTARTHPAVLYFSNWFLDEF